jgi:hypothetical protein
MKIKWLSLGCMGCGAMMSGPLHALIHHRFRAYYATGPGLFWFAIAINAVVIYLLIWRAREVARDSRNAAIPQKKAGIASSLIGIVFNTTPFVRICVYGGAYILGVCLFFFY